MVIRIRKGKIILEELTSKLNFSEFSINPGAKILINIGMKISERITSMHVIKSKIREILPANILAEVLFG
jgi:hypothetical protein